ncbi:hypothetical protein TSUD_317250 [Trifolium subterraneum]|uniref:Uncharacterized protein n=1 Tax=Trifolium subterraneum TaxID=3900 RepID=A0A2Z6NBP2_TRISU|nr:hypothetical protein TSUD_317250 [Trifolium subterraneum]
MRSYFINCLSDSWKAKIIDELVDAVVYLVDAYDKERFAESKKELDALLSDESLAIWNPRALYFPNFASAEQCESIIKMARADLTPSRLQLREGETEEGSKGVRTSKHDSKVEGVSVKQAKLEDTSCSSNQCRMEGVRLLGQGFQEKNASESLSLLGSEVFGLQQITPTDLDV